MTAIDKSCLSEGRKNRCWFRTCQKGEWHEPFTKRVPVGAGVPRKAVPDYGTCQGTLIFYEDRPPYMAFFGANF